VGPEEEALAQHGTRRTHDFFLGTAKIPAGRHNPAAPSSPPFAGTQCASTVLQMIDILGLVIAALGGTAVGVERQWSGHADGDDARFAGVRTFTMLGGLGGLAGWLWQAGFTLPATVLVAAAAALTTAAYVARMRVDIDGTTEVAALVVIAAGVVAGAGIHHVASGVIAVTTLLLVEKSRLHALVKRIDDIGLRTAARFGVMALVVLPLLPEGPYGPLGGIRPRELWTLVLFFSGLSFVGYFARRVAGPGRGYLVTGLIGGLASSTNVTFTFARTSRTDQGSSRALAFGAIAANAMLYPRVLVATAVLNLSLLPYVLPYLVLPALLAVAITWIGARDEYTEASAEQQVPNPLQLPVALQMAAIFQAVLMLVWVAGRYWGDRGIVSTAAVLGLTDVDALTISMARRVASSVSLETAAVAIAIGVLSNTALKLSVALFFGSPGFRRVAGGTLLGMIVAAGASLLFGR
jgi:uncharacterized membrane protein (DUF4010 family)